MGREEGVRYYWEGECRCIGGVAVPGVAVAGMGDRPYGVDWVGEGEGEEGGVSSSPGVATGRPGSGQGVVGDGQGSMGWWGRD